MYTATKKEYCNTPQLHKCKVSSRFLYVKQRRTFPQQPKRKGQQRRMAAREVKQQMME